MRPIEALARHKPFRDFLSGIYGSLKSVRIKSHNGGHAKIVFIANSENHTRKIVIKEMRSEQDDTYHRSSNSTNLKSKNDALWSAGLKIDLAELHIIRAAQDSPDQHYFPKYHRAFFYLHPIKDPDKYLPAQFTTEAKALKEWRDYRGVSLFLVEDFIEGREPNKQELQMAERIKEDGMTRNPYIWTQVDVDYDDVIIKADGSPVFIDRGKPNVDRISLQRVEKHREL